jgi:hypothetical protein
MRKSDQGTTMTYNLAVIWPGRHGWGWCGGSVFLHFIENWVSVDYFFALKSAFELSLWARSTVKSTTRCSLELHIASSHMWPVNFPTQLYCCPLNLMTGIMYSKSIMRRAWNEMYQTNVCKSNTSCPWQYQREVFSIGCIS